MKILYTQEADWIKRNPIIQHNLLEILTLRGHSVHVIDFEALWSHEKHSLFSRRTVYEKMIRLYPDSKVTLIRPGIIKLPILDYVSVMFTHKGEINRQMKEWHPDIILGVSILDCYWAARQTRKTPVPFIYYWMELTHCLIPYKPLQFLGKIVEKATLRHSDKILATTESLKNAVIDMGAQPQRVQLLRTGVNLKVYETVYNRDVIRNKYGLKSDDRVIFFMGWMYFFSGLKEVCIQIARVNDPQIKLLLVGEGDARDEIVQTINKYGLSDRVILAGQKPFSEIPEHLSAADICILPAQNNETMRDIVPGKIYEYMAAGKPIISTRLQGMIKEFGMDNGILYVDQPEDVVPKAVELFNDKDTCRNLGAKAKSYMQKYSWEAIADELENILKTEIKAKKQHMQ
jgi:glycosyltransferase involved in cell wall biosynthesis